MQRGGGLAGLFRTQRPKREARGGSKCLAGDGDNEKASRPQQRQQKNQHQQETGSETTRIKVVWGERGEGRKRGRGGPACLGSLPTVAAILIDPTKRPFQPLLRTGYVASCYSYNRGRCMVVVATLPT